MYKLRTQIPLKARLLIFHSFIQSHLNYCSLVWGLSAKSHIDSLFAKQKSGIRAVMSGYVSYKYNKEDGTLPTHTKSFFKEHKILTIHGIIAKNALVFMHQVKFFRDTLPPSVSGLISQNAPCFSTSQEFDDHLEWNNKYNSVSLRSSLFFKGPLLAISKYNEAIISDRSFNKYSLSSYKSSAKSHLLNEQNIGETDQWPNFLINNIQGLRSSKRI